MTAFNIGNIYDFNTLAPSILGASVKRAKLIGILDYSSALKYSNVDLMYRTIYPLLPANTLNDAKNSIYYLFETNNSGNVVYCEQWIDLSSVVLVTTTTYRVTISNSSPQDITTLRDVLNSLGFTDYYIETI